MATDETPVRKVGVGDLRGIIVDSDELRKGTELFDRGELSSFARHGGKLFAEARGSSSSPYKVTVTFSETSTSVRAHCNCKAALSRPFCKHAAALLVAWSRAPEAFAVSEGPPPGAAGAPRKRAVKSGKVEAADLMRQGVAQVTTLVRELGASGVAAIGEDRLPQLRTLGENLRDYKLRRLSARALDLVDLLEAGAAPGVLRPLAYAEVMADLLLTARKLEKHQAAGEPLDPRHVEELVGKTWAKGDLLPVAGLDLVEYAYATRITSDQFVIYESRFFDLASGTHYSEKQIQPLAIRSAEGAKPSRAGAVLTGLRGGRYPGYPPFRLKISDLGSVCPVDHAALERLVEGALPTVGAALAALSEHRRDVFAPDRLPVALRVDTLFARGGRMQAVDAEGHALHLPEGRALEDRLGSALGGARLAALLGDVGVEAALPTLFPMAAVIEGPLGFELRTLQATDGGAARASSLEAGSAAWARAAREAGASGAAIALAEVREALADAFVVGLAALASRTTEPLEARLRELGMEKQAALLHGLVDKVDAQARLDDFVKLYQVLGIALVRLAGATEVDRATLARVPTYESVFVAQPARWLLPDEIARLRAADVIGRYEAAVHYAHHYEGLPPEELLASIYPTWADGSASPYVVRAIAGRREDALAAAKKALAGKGGRVAKITALRVLAAVGGLEASHLLHEVMTTERDIGLRGLAADARDAIETRTLGAATVQRRRAPTLQRVAEAAAALASAPNKELRVLAVDALVKLGHLSALPALRQAFHGDASQEVRREAALALALLGDTEMVDTFVTMLGRRGEADRDAKIAADALGLLGDVRGLRELLAAFAEGYKPAVVGEALRSMGPVAVEPLVALIEAQPRLAERKAGLSVLEQLPDRELAEVLVARVRALPGGEAGAGFDEAAKLYLELGRVHPYTWRAVAQAVLDALTEPDAHKALVKAARRALS